VAACRSTRALGPMNTGLGLARKTVRLLPYDSRWSQAFDQASILRRLLAPEIGAVEHIGSTAIRGMDAKPILDMMVELRSLRASWAFYATLHSLGYEHRPADEVPDRIFFAKGPHEGRTHHLSACEADSRFWRVHLAFRNALRDDSSLAAEYLELKRSLALRFPRDRDCYTNGKEAFVNRVVGAMRGA
jgi:GrpB-like predicted nucleotidyltransferase (UPF0157 family)